MSDSHQLEDKLAKLKEDYKNKLPNKIKELMDSWQELATKPNAEILANLHRKTHSLHGTANTYGFEEVGKAAAELENFISPSLNNPTFVIENADHVKQLLERIRIKSQELDNQVTTTVQVEKVNAIENQTIYLFDDIDIWENDLASKLVMFGFKTRKLGNANALIQQINEKLPGLLIININLLTEELENLLAKINTDKKIPIIFTSTSGEFALRLKSVRLGCNAFFVKPFEMENLIAQADYLLKLEQETIRILIIDDEVEVANYYANVLEQANMKTCIINRSIEIDKALHEFYPDLILIDINMPECNGLELAKIIRQQTMFQSTPIIYLSAEADKLKQLDAMKVGADDFITKSDQHVFLISTIKNRVERYKKLRALLIKDNLTGLYNHSFILNQLEIELKEAMQLHNPLSIVIIYLDKFKNINETYGHQAGDHVLKSLALMIQSRLHTNEIIGRYSAAKFIILLPNTTKEAAIKLVDELKKKFLSLNYSAAQQIFNASFSAGIASFPEYHSSADLIAAAEEELAK